ncbi:N-acetylmuramic acid 6-phosphate etherase [Synechococcus sp. Nb3U1]|uniref:N-acetylmuramic acid 6-phosphate etherase n=1 Tax=Synechococcus sp. Nb3U1 TaxID=1914529 RepID=UPI001F3F2875|nr:N-acetylmuramic acid 6-phosphate etherase [Synechococcus sp. Nb3U1]MCF2972785.1 N-acetylmuramic acid 6-phosphate etherase [Synechococcus sp. Nb3U1]
MSLMQPLWDPGSLTESRNPATAEIDDLSTLELVQQINAEDRRVPEAVAHEAKRIAAAIEAIAERMQRGGRLIYIGAGTSGRLGVLDAAECPPTFSTQPGQVIGLIAGGEKALTQAVEGAEDDGEAGALALRTLSLQARDSVVGIAASGRTPFVLGGIQAARGVGALTVGLACNHPSPLTEQVDIAIAPLVGPEVILGSTRMKAGTAQKLVLNTISTGVMIRLGKTYGNLMVDLQASNAKLKRRAERMVALACDLDATTAAQLLEACGGEVKTAILVALMGCSAQEARQHLQQANGRIRQVLHSALPDSSQP